jgi:hypothetical protein
MRKRIILLTLAALLVAVGILVAGYARRIADERAEKKRELERALRILREAKDIRIVHEVEVKEHI